MRTGGKPVPTALKIIRGNPGKRAMPKNEPQPEAGATPPEWLGKYGLAHWAEIAPQLEKVGILTVMDAQALGDMCFAYQKWREAVDKETNSVSYVTAQSGFPVLAPWVTEGEKQRGIWRKLQAEFGMTPSSRSRVTVSKAPKKENPFIALIQGNKK